MWNAGRFRLRPLDQTLHAQQGGRQQAERELDLSNAIKNETTEEVRNIEEKKEFQADAYIRESMAIIADYINLQQTTK